MNMTVVERFEQQIQNGSLPKPIPPWAITAKRVCVWGGLGLTVAAGAASTAVSWWLIADPNGMLKEFRASDWMQGALDLLPVAWIALSLGAGLFAYWLFAHTTHGYRYRRPLVICSLGLGLLAFGGALYVTDLAESIEAATAQLPGYERFIGSRRPVLMRPDKGTIIGHIENPGQESWILVDPNGAVWRITIATSTTLPNGNRGQNVVLNGGCVRVMGLINTTTRAVQANAIRPCPRAVRFNPNLQPVPAP